MTKLYGKALSMRFQNGAPPLAVSAVPDAMPPVEPLAAMPDTTAAVVALPEPAPVPDTPPVMEAASTPEPRRRRVLDAGEEARLGKRKSKRVAGLLRGGRNSPDWGEAVEWMGAKVPEGLNDRLAILARHHKLHRWQVIVEAIDCFERTHGSRAGAKRSA